MNKFLLAFLCLAVCQLAYAEKSWDEEDVEEDDESRAFWDKLFNFFKKTLSVEPLNCQGANCRTCVKVLGKGGCIGIGYNKQGGANAAIQVSVQSGSGRNIWNGNINAGRPVPSCVNLPKPIKEVCIQNFWVTVGQNGQNGDVCFTINFKSYSTGIKFCAGYTAQGGFAPHVHPQIVRT
uniref:Trialysin 1 n=1 Tax=Riptortus pedestris TaxID=329032 RepID=A0A1B4X9A9_RIPPE|nr:trialysin 1 [Riptortus pedestris]